MSLVVGRDLAAVSGAAPRPALTNTAWIVHGRLELSEWLDYGRRLGALGRGVAWWLGDWLRYGNAAYGERYTRAVRATGYDAQSLMNMAYVASRFAAERRRERLSWSHHAELAGLAPSEQEHWLDLAQEHRISVHALRIELRASRRAGDARAAGDDTLAGDAEPRDPESPAVVCPNCKHRIEVRRKARRGSGDA